MANKLVLTETHFMLGNHTVVEATLAEGCDFLLVSHPFSK